MEWDQSLPSCKYLVPSMISDHWNCSNLKKCESRKLCLEALYNITHSWFFNGFVSKSHTFSSFTSFPFRILKHVPVITMCQGRFYSQQLSFLLWPPESNIVNAGYSFIFHTCLLGWECKYNSHVSRTLRYWRFSTDCSLYQKCSSIPSSPK